MKHLLLPSSLPLLLHRPSKTLLLHARRCGCIPNAASDGNGDPSPVASEPSSADTVSQPSTPSSSKPTGIKNRLKTRKQARRVHLDSPAAPVTPKKKAAAGAAAPRIERQRGKEWEEMSLAEKAVELYVGEKGLLFWLNKFAYASIFIMVGAWVLFRFVGPSLGLYQLDAPPLPPTAVFSG
ncbi:uncharacterized protein LOC133931263 [Phragmites australis]|uniref:uncharacterized protein LOC133931263 n=1 Tax=Phragmites australis TaxID=29695 RepID=UPI002D788F0E|nr:uncharacterized protein LOC133931263 [Phragmites australis]